MSNPKSLSDSIVRREFDKTDPRVTTAIREVFNAFKKLADGHYPEDEILKVAVSVVAGFRWTVDQDKRRRLPIIVPRA